jgi:PAS domain S-box-containing protein
VFLLGMAATYVAWQLAQEAARARAAAMFSSRATEVAQGFTKRFAEYESLLRAGAALVEFKGGINRDEWRAFAARLDSVNRYPGMRTLGFARVVRPGEVSALEQRVRRETGEAYRVWPQASAGATRVPVVYVEPLAQSLRALGFDMASDSVRTEALARARDSGEPAVTGKLTLIYDESQQRNPGFVAYAPVYRHGGKVGSVEGRRASIQGYVYGAFRMNEVIGPLLGALPEALHVAVYDSRDARPDDLLFDTAVASGASRARRRPLYNVDVPVEMGQSVWLLRFRSSPAFEAGQATPLPGMIAGSGAALTLALMAVVFALGRTRERAEHLAARMTRELRDAQLHAERNRLFLEAMIHAIPQPVYVKDEQHRWVMANDAAARFVGGGQQGIAGLRDEDVLEPESAQAAYAEDDQLLAGGAPLLHEVLVKRRDGSTRWGLKSKNVVQMPDGSRYVVGITLDVTEHVEARLALERNRRFLHEVLDAMPVAVCVKDAQHRWLHVNTAFCRLFGVAPEDLVGRTDADRMDAETAALRFAEDDRVLATGQPLVIEQHQHLADGTAAWMLKSKLPVDLHDGGRGLVVVLTDITANKQAQAQIESARELLDAVLNASPSPLWVKDEAGRWILINDAGARLLGGERGTFLGKTVHEIYSAELAQRAARQDETALASDVVYSVEGEISAVNGEVRWGIKRKRGITLPDGSRGVVIAMFDITLLRRAAEEVERAREFLEEIIDSAPQPVFVKDTAHRWVVVNKAFCERFGLRKEDMLGRTDADLTSEEWARRSFETDRAALASPVPLQWEEPLKQFDGSPRWIVRTKRAVQLRDGTRYVVGITNDVTDLKQAQEELRGHRDNLQQLVDERTHELRAAVEASQRANRAKSEFLAKMSHELRTPMHAILSFARLGTQRAAASRPEPDKLAHYFRRIDQSGSRLLALVNDLLDLSKLEAGRMHYEFGEHDLLVLAGAVVQELASLAAAAGVRLHVAAQEGGECVVRCDPLRVAQVMRNLLSNAIRFTGGGGEVRVRMEAEANAVRVSVEDTGVGIPAEELECVFESFVQSSRTRSNAGGTGLGLPICREIVEGHGGRIWAEVRSGGGSRLVFVLPRSGRRADEVTQGAAVPGPVAREGRAA